MCPIKHKAGPRVFKKFKGKPVVPKPRIPKRKTRTPSPPKTVQPPKKRKKVQNKIDILESHGFTVNILSPFFQL